MDYAQIFLNEKLAKINYRMGRLEFKDVSFMNGTLNRIDNGNKIYVFKPCCTFELYIPIKLDHLKTDVILFSGIIRPTTEIHIHEARIENVIETIKNQYQIDITEYMIQHKYLLTENVKKKKKKWNLLTWLKKKLK